MKTLITTALVLFFYALSYSQVGINTVDPTRTLDVNGTLRVRRMVDAETEQATNLVGVDENGNFIQVEAGQNLYLNDNIIKSNSSTYSIERDLDIIDGATINNLVVFPGGPVHPKKIITIRTLLPATLLTGIVAAPDGTSIILYPIDGDLNLSPLNALSLPANQIQSTNDLIIEQFEAVEFFYDASIQKWVRM